MAHTTAQILMSEDARGSPSHTVGAPERMLEPIRALSDAGSDRVELEPAVRVSIDQDGRPSALQLQLATDRSRGSRVTFETVSSHARSAA